MPNVLPAGNQQPSKCFPPWQHHVSVQLEGEAIAAVPTTPKPTAPTGQNQRPVVAHRGSTTSRYSWKVRPSSWDRYVRFLPTAGTSFVAESRS